MFNLQQRSEENTITTQQTVKTTGDLHQFRNIKGNRQLNESNVSAISAQIQHRGQMIPIIVNSKFEVIDGQHRLEACKRLNQPIKYIVDKTANIESVITANVVGRNWTEFDHVSRHAAEGKPAYIRLKKWIEECKELGINYGPAILIAQLSGTRRTCYMFDDGKIRGRKKDKTATALYGVGTDIKIGHFNFPDLKKSKEVLEAVTGFSSFSFAHKSGFVIALIQCMRIKEFKPARLIENSQKYPRKFTNEPTTDSFLEMFEKVYNYKARTKLPLVLNPQRLKA